MACDGITLEIGDINLSARLASFKEIEEIQYKNIITTIDGTDHPVGKIRKTKFRFTLIPGTLQDDINLSNVLSLGIFRVWYSRFEASQGDMYNGDMRLSNGYEMKYLLKSEDGHVRYGGSEIELISIH